MNIRDTLTDCLAVASGVVMHAERMIKCHLDPAPDGSREAVARAATKAAAMALAAAMAAVEALPGRASPKTPPSPGFAGSAKPSRRQPRPKTGKKPPPP